MVNLVSKESHSEAVLGKAVHVTSSSSHRHKSNGFFKYLRIVGAAFIAFFVGVVWPALRKNVFIPISIFFLAVFSAVEKSFTSKKHSFMCIAHQMTAKLARARAQRLTGIALLTGIVVFLFSTAFYSFGIEVIIDGESLGYVISQEDYNECVTKVQNRVSKIMGQPHSVNPNVAFSFGIVARDEIMEGKVLEDVLYSKVEGIQQLYAVSVDGKLVGACTTKEGAEQALSLLTASSDPNVKKEILNDIEISYDAVDVASLCTPEELSALLTNYETKHLTHVIAKGDTARSICNSYGMTRAELRELNPEVDTSDLIAGQELVVLKASPVVSVKQYHHVIETVSIPYETQEIKDSSLYVGKTSVKTNGVAGQKQVVSDVVYVDGDVTERTIISETVISEPVTKVVLVGTKPVPKKAATGTFSRPVKGGVISSYYGYRRSGFHTGVDYALATGNPVYASDGGTVSYAGWKSGGFGYLVVINHGNGIQSYYGHNSKILVTRGQKVAKGEQIAKIGSTGNSTGPHVHFEIRVNGKHVNPMRYLS